MRFEQEYLLHIGLVYSWSTYWSTAAAKVAVAQPSSAAAERVFSILNRSLNDTQNSALQDLVETFVMMQFNNRELSCVCQFHLCVVVIVKGIIKNYW